MAASAFSALEAFLGLGFMAGPILGGFLYHHAGGYPAPFLALGLSLMALAVLAAFLSTCCCVGPDDGVADSEAGHSKTSIYPTNNGGMQNGSSVGICTPLSMFCTKFYICSVGTY